MFSCTRDDPLRALTGPKGSAALTGPKGIVASTSVPHGLSCTTLYKYINRVVQATREGRCIRQLRARP